MTAWLAVLTICIGVGTPAERCQPRAIAASSFGACVQAVLLDYARARKRGHNVGEFTCLRVEGER